MEVEYDRKSVIREKQNKKLELSIGKALGKRLERRFPKHVFSSGWDDIHGSVIAKSVHTRLWQRLAFIPFIISIIWITAGLTLLEHFDILEFGRFGSDNWVVLASCGLFMLSLVFGILNLKQSGFGTIECSENNVVISVRNDNDALLMKDIIEESGWKKLNFKIEVYERAYLLPWEV